MCVALFNNMTVISYLLPITLQNVVHIDKHTSLIQYKVYNVTDLNQNENFKYYTTLWLLYQKAEHSTACK